MRTLAALVVMTGLAQADTPRLDLAKELKATVAKLRIPNQMQVMPVGGKGCIATTQAEREAVTKRVLAWIDAAHPDELGATLPGDISLVVTFGCKESSGALALDVSQDRIPAPQRPNTWGTRRNYLLRVTSAIEVLAEDTSTPSESWMEWADEGRIRLLAQIDLDGDRALDLVYSDHEHEGGAIDSFDKIHVRYATGRRAESAQVVNLTDVQLVKDQLVIAGQTRNEQVYYGCLGRDLRLDRCAASAPLQRLADRRSIVDRYSNLAAGDVPDREQLVQELSLLGLMGKRTAVLVASAAETDPVVRVERKVAAFLVKAGLVEPKPMPDVVTQPNPDARRYLDDLTTKLGDTACTTTPLTDADRAAATAWVRTQDEKATQLVMAPSGCGPTTWIAWSGANDNGMRRQVLLDRDGKTRILGFTYLQDMGEIDLAQSDAWFTHDGAVIGIAIANQNLWVIANGKVVAQTKGTVARYRADDRWGESSIDVFVDNGTLWHATPTGREKLDLTLVRDHEARRAAIAMLQSVGPTGNAKYLAALQLLGADAALIAECRKLP